jgi:ribose-phosphate pyrophosphokinase
MNNMKIFSGESNSPLVAKVCELLGVPVGKITLKTFPSGERYCQFEENIRGTDLFLVQSLSAPVNDYLMELLVMCDAARRASAGRITVVIPYFGYARQDRKDKSRVPISARLVMDLLKASGVNRILTMDLHSPQTVGFTNLPCDQLCFKPALVNVVREIGIDAVVSPDIGAVKRADEYASALKTDLVIISKKRNNATSVEVKHFIGEVSGKKVLILDDLTESAGTLIEAANACYEQGAAEIYCAISHGCFTTVGVKRMIGAFKDGLIKKLFVSNSVKIAGRWIDQNEQEDFDGTVKDYAYHNIQTVDVSPLFATAIKNIHNNESVSELFK